MSLHHVEHVMGTTISMDLVGTHDRALLDRLVAWFHQVDEVYSPYKEGSIVTRIGRGEIDRDHPSIGEVADVLDRCDELWRMSDGVFDVWNLPSPNGTTFDPCGYVKGWSVQRAADMLREEGVVDFCLNAGGDIALGGRSHIGEPWRIGIRHPHDPASIAMVLEAEGPFAIATSGSYERGAHIVDPRTGERCAEIASVTVIGRDLADVDAYATIAYAMGVEGLAWVADHTDADACVITHELGLIPTVGFLSHLVMPASSSH